MSIPGGSSNPYQQPPYGAAPAAYGYSQGPAGFGPMVPPQPGPPPRGGGMPGWLYGVGGVLVTSAAWGGVMFATGAIGSDDTADLAGYRFEADLCGTADMAAFEADYQPYEDDEPTSQAAQTEALDISSCEFTLEPTGADSDSYYSAYMMYELSWHKGTDPAPEFAARAEAFEQYNEGDGYYDYRTEPLADLGEEAFIIFGEDALSGDLTWASVTVRDGWFEYSLTWNAYLGDDPDGLAEEDRVRDMLRDATEETLAALRDGTGEGDGPDGGVDGGVDGGRDGNDDGGTEGPDDGGSRGGPGEPEAV
ncbi:hypothetical protein [Streptomyces johnsoniae]|uniref:Uncharacterized protein n=1 Tax=Streptomyces johnsoniae TaxID=3075532 RepID=A0ABU2S4T4_9ACTN|nr:hypothetical protein [Streptomyces sp. DSM 41886]MDT0443998.1 hypothetical protein [Streptomyces sp. DSM 41886]